MVEICQNGQKATTTSLTVNIPLLQIDPNQIKSIIDLQIFDVVLQIANEQVIILVVPTLFKFVKEIIYLFI